MECDGKNMEYKPCGDPCMPTCSDREAANCGDLGPCGEGCFCKKGFVFDGEKDCISEDTCGCEVPELGIYINVCHVCPTLKIGLIHPINAMPSGVRLESRISQMTALSPVLVKKLVGHCNVRTWLAVTTTSVELKMESQPACAIPPSLKRMTNA